MKTKILLSASLFLLAAAGCTTIREMPKAQIEQEAATPEHKICRELLMCFLKNDPSGFQKRLSPEASEKFDAAQFASSREAIVRSLGDPVSFRYLTTLEFMALKPHLWAIRFHRKDKHDADVYSEALFRIISGRADNGEILILGFSIL